MRISKQARFRRALSSAIALAMGAVAMVGIGTVTTAGPAGAGPSLHGIDVSGWQGTVDWAAVRRSGRVFAFAKATEGATFVDSTFGPNRVGMAANGLALRGFYHFARPDRNSAATEASHFLRTIGSLGLGEVAVLDLEVAPSPKVGDWAAEWLDIVAKATGRTPILYSYQSYLYEIPTSRLTQYPLWVASWGADDGTVPATAPKTDRWSRWTWWQYTSKAAVPGVAGRVDDNLFFGSALELGALASAPASSPPPDALGDLVRGLLGGLLGGAAPKS